MTDTLYRWVKASERMPYNEGRTIVKRLGEPMVTDARLRKNDSMVFVYPNGMTWPGYKDFEWLEPIPSNTESLEEAAESYANTVAVHEGFHSADNQHTINLLRIAFASGAAYEKGDIDKVVEQLREVNPYCGEIDFSEDARIAWEKSCDKLKELLNQSK